MQRCEPLRSQLRGIAATLCRHAMSWVEVHLPEHAQPPRGCSLQAEAQAATQGRGDFSCLSLLTSFHWHVFQRQAKKKIDTTPLA